MNRSLKRILAALALAAPLALPVSALAQSGAMDTLPGKGSTTIPDTGVKPIDEAKDKGEGALPQKKQPDTKDDATKTDRAKPDTTDVPEKSPLDDTGARPEKKDVAPGVND